MGDSISTNTSGHTTKKVLFVDDEPRVLEGIENILFLDGTEWDATFVTSGEAALAALREHHFDIVVSDLAMPGMDGLELLRRITVEYPDVVRIMLSSCDEHTPVATSVAHMFLRKPYNRGTLVHALDQVRHTRDLINDSVVRQLATRLGDLPARPRTHAEITRIMSDDDWSLKDLVNALAKDIGVSANLIRVANSAYFSCGWDVTDLGQAVARVGGNCVRGLVMAYEVFHSPGPVKMGGTFVEELGERSFLVGKLARQLVADQHLQGEAFLAGMLHDVGILVLARQLGDYRDIVATAMESGKQLHAVESEALGTTHAEIGAYVLGLWGMSYTSVEAVADHHHPWRTPHPKEDVLAAVYVADRIVHEVKPPWVGVPSGFLSNEISYLQSLGVLDKLPKWMKMGQALVDES